MDTIKGADAIKSAENITRAGGDFIIAFYSYSRSKRTASTTLKTYKGCKIRKQLPHDKFSVDGANYFLFDDQNGKPKMCYKVLIRFIGFPADNYKLKEVHWYE